MNAPVLIPAKVYVGDEGRLFFPLPQSISLPKTGALPLVTVAENQVNSAVIIDKVGIDRANNALVIDFRAWMPGSLTLPSLSVDGVSVNNITVNIASILENAGDKGMVLSPPVPPLATPDTGVFALGVSLVLVFACLACLWFKKDGRDRFTRLFGRLRRAMLARRFYSGLAQTRKSVADGSIDPLAALDSADRTFRVFLGDYYKSPCLSFVPDEFLGFPAGGVFLRGLFTLSGNLRFSGSDVTRREALDFVGRVGEFKRELNQPAVITDYRRSLAR